eukprot:1025768_1
MVYRTEVSAPVNPQEQRASDASDINPPERRIMGIDDINPQERDIIPMEMDAPPPPEQIQPPLPPQQREEDEPQPGAAEMHAMMNKLNALYIKVDEMHKEIRVRDGILQADEEIHSIIYACTTLKEYSKY